MHDVEHILHTRLAFGRQAPEVGTAEHHRTRTQSQCLHHVTAAADAAVQQHLDLVPDGLGDGYYWLPCSIKGRLVADGRPWDFEINAAATAVWRDGDTAYYPQGVADPDYCVLKFTAQSGRYYSNFKSEDFAAG